MASSRFPFSHVPGEIPFSLFWETKRSPTYDEDYRRPMMPKRHAHVDMVEPQEASCIRFDHRQAIHLLQHCLSLSHKDSIRLQRQGAPQVSPLRVGFPRSEAHQLDTRQPGHPTKRPAGETIKTESAQSPFSTSDCSFTEPTLRTGKCPIRTPSPFAQKEGVYQNVCFCLAKLDVPLSI
jgi:hypothetical protein